MTFTFTTTDKQDQAIQWLTDQYNVGNPDSPLTPEQYVQSRVAEALGEALRKVDADWSDYVTKQIVKADSVTKAQIVALLQKDAGSN